MVIDASIRKKRYSLLQIFTLGVPDHVQSLEREKKIVRWLDSVKH
jgi:hypothetical protein